ncbi:hypothetical protein P775_20845 [Puniceibacterium antarcticum]|uniref:Uncharacterized protein n=1 Tax=Puniceibacterium antarcticum TaxID=1206336 RepID=A0A2G8R9K0_9RHOB|nr:hypothetical protein P775_20845 [Puniceibacterium antarcticum]
MRGKLAPPFEFTATREEEWAAELWWEWAPNGPIPKLRCGDTREEERCRRDFDRPREEERAAELWWEWVPNGPIPN